MIRLEGARIERDRGGGGLSYSYFSPNGRLWLPGMGARISIAIQIIRGAGHSSVIRAGRAPSIGLKSVSYFWAGRLADGSDILIQKSSLRDFFQSIGFPLEGSEQESLLSWQNPIPLVRREVAKLGRVISDEQCREVVKIYQRAGRGLREVLAQYLLVMDRLRPLLGEALVEAHYLAILRLVDMWGRSFEDVLGGYFECLALREEISLYPEYLKGIGSLLRHHPRRSVARAVQSFVVFSRFGRKHQVPVDSLIASSSSFSQITHDYRITLDAALEVFLVACELSQVMHRSKRTRDGINEIDMTRILIVVKQRSELWNTKYAKELKEGPIRISSDALLPRSIIYGPKQDFIGVIASKRGQFYRHPQGRDEIRGKGADSVVKDVFDLISKKPYVLVIQLYGSIPIREMKLYSFLYRQGFPARGIAKAFFMVEWTSKSAYDENQGEWRRVEIVESGSRKVGILMAAYPSDLRDEMVRIVGSTFENRLRVAIDIADALAYLHSLGFVHRDLKPDNIFLDDECHIYLGDLRRGGIVGGIDDPLGGALWYQPPEYRRPYVRAFSEKPDAKAEKECIEASNPPLDIWAFGLILLELLDPDLKKFPSFLESRWDIFLRLKNYDHPLFFKEHWLIETPDSGAEEKGTVAEVVRACLDLDPAKRPTAACVRERLRAIVATCAK